MVGAPVVDVYVIRRLCVFFFFISTSSSILIVFALLVCAIANADGVSSVLCVACKFSPNMGKHGHKKMNMSIIMDILL